MTFFTINTVKNTRMPISPLSLALATQTITSGVPVITTQPQAGTVTEPTAATFTVTATSIKTPITYQWQRNGINISGATANSYTLSPTALSDNGAQFRCVITNSYGSVSSNPATLIVNSGVVPTGTVATLTLHPTTTATLPYSAGIYPQEGQVPAGSSIISDDDASLRGTVVSTWPDGSARIVVVSGDRSVSNGVTQQINLKAGTGSGASLTTANIASIVTSVAVNVPGVGSATLSSFGSPLKTWWANPRLICASYRLTIGNGMVAIVYIHAFSGGRALVEVTVENSEISTATSSPTAPSSKSYTGATVTVNGSTIATVSSSSGPQGTHQAFRAWYCKTWVGGDPGLEVTHDTASLQAHPLFFKAWQAGGSMATYASDAYSIWGTGRYRPTDMGGGGDHAQIGYLTRWDAQYIQTGAKECRRASIASTLSTMTYPTVYRSSQTGLRPLISAAGTNYTMSGTYPGSPEDSASWEPNWELAHAPAAGLVTFLVHPSPVIIEIAQTIAFKTRVVRWWDEVRTKAWSLRNHMHAMFLTPDGDSWRTDAQTFLVENLNAVNEYNTLAANKLDAIWDYSSSTVQDYGGSAGVQMSMWQHHFLSIVAHRLAEAKLLSGADQALAETVADFAVTQPIRYVNEAFGGQFRQHEYTKTISQTSGSITQPNNWGELWKWQFGTTPTAVAGQWVVGPDDSSPWPNANTGGASYDTAYWAAFVDGVERDIPGAREAWDKVNVRVTNLSTWATGFAADPRYAHRPRNEFTPSYSLPSPGTAIDMPNVTNATANSIAPGPYASNTAAWQYSLFGSYGGGAFVRDYSAAGAMVFALGGGHNAPPNVGAAIFDFTTGSWSYLHNANGIAVRTTDWNSAEFVTQNGYGPTLPGSSPPMMPPAHLYTHVQPLPARIAGNTKGAVVFLAPAYAGSGSVSNRWAWKMDLDTGLVTKISTNQTTSVGGEAIQDEHFCWFDEVAGRYAFNNFNWEGRNNMLYLDTSDWTWKVQGFGQAQQNTINENYSGFFDPTRRIAGVIGRNPVVVLRVIDLDNYTGSTRDVTVSSPDGTTLSSIAWPDNNWQLYPVDGCFYLYENRSPNKSTLFKLAPPSTNYLTETWTLSRQTFTYSGGTMPNREQDFGSGGDINTSSYNRFFYVPMLRCFAYIASGQSRTILIKPQ